MPVLVGNKPKPPKKPLELGGVWILIALGLPAIAVVGGAAIIDWQQNKAYSTSQPVVTQPASSVAATPAPAANVTPSPKPVAPPQATGIGVSRAAIQTVFEHPNIGFKFETSSNVKGQPRVMGTSPNGLATVELIGPPNNLVSATIMTGLPNDDEKVRMLNVMYTLGFIEKAAPQWTNGSDWWSENFVAIAKGGSSAASTTFADKRASLVMARELGVFTLTIEHQ